MTRTGPTRQAPEGWGSDRFRVAEAYAFAARVVFDLVEDGPANPAVSLCVSAAIAFADALSVKAGGYYSTGQHAAADQVLRSTLGNRLPKAQATNLARVIAMKDESQYQPRAIRRAEAEKVLAQLEEFAAWARQEFER